MVVLSGEFRRAGFVSVEELGEVLHEPDLVADLVIVDCRFYLGDEKLGRANYLASHIPHAVYAHLDEDLSSSPQTDSGRHPLPSPAQLTALFSRLGIDSTKIVVAYDQRNGAIASRLWWMLRYMGHTQAFVLDGGWQAWSLAEKPIANGLEKNGEAKFRGKPHRDAFITMDEVPHVKTLIDSRAAERYRGETEPIDPIAGHIPSAKNLHFAAHWDEYGKIKPVALVKSQFEVVLSDQSASDAVFYCGSGVTACANLLAMHSAGLPIGRLYVGSWSEWSRKITTNS